MTREETLKIAKPLPLNARMAKAVLDGRKKQTRRVLPFKIYTDKDGNITAYSDEKNMRSRKCNNISHIKGFLKYKVGDILWVREPVKIINFLQTGSMSEGDYEEKIFYKYMADSFEDFMDVPNRFDKTPAYFKNCKGIPNGCIKEMARLFLKVTDVRVELLQNITNEDVIKEGIEYKIDKDEHITFIDDWIELWNSTAKKDCKWEDNPYVPVYEFERIKSIK